MSLNNPLDAGSLRVFASTATGGTTTTIECTGLPTDADFNGNIVVLTSGTYKGESRTINGSTTGGTITVDSAFSGAVSSGIKFGIFALRSTTVAVSDVAADVGDASACGLGSLYGILGCPTETMTACLSHKGSCMEFWSITDAILDLPDAPATDVDCPNIIVSLIPAGATIFKVLGMIQFRKIANLNAGGNNAIQGAQNIRIKKSTVAWTESDIFFPLVDNQWDLAASTSEGGGIFTADDASDCHDEVDENATYNVRFEDALVDFDTLTFYDLKVGLKIWFI
jgi:hypothetical protein